MFTDYCIINPLYEEMWNCYFTMENRELVARYNIRQAIHSMVHQAIHTIKQDPTDPKKIMNGLRIARTLEALEWYDTSYKKCIWMNDDVREHRFKTPDPAFVKLLLTTLEGWLKDIDEVPCDQKLMHNIDSFLEEFIIDLIKHRMSF
jgi:hypothetical protein